MHRHCGDFSRSWRHQPWRWLCWPGPAIAGPTVDEIAPPLPVFYSDSTNWVPKYPYPYDQTRGSVTDAEIAAEREMCQWFNASTTR